MAGRRTPPDLGYYKEIELTDTDTDKKCIDKCNEDIEDCVMFTFYSKVIKGPKFCRFYQNTVEVDDLYTGAQTYKRQSSEGLFSCDYFRMHY